MANTTLHTDEAKAYPMMAGEFAADMTTNHSEDHYVRYIDGQMTTTNDAEGFFP